MREEVSDLDVMTETQLRALCEQLRADLKEAKRNLAVMPAPTRVNGMRRMRITKIRAVLLTTADKSDPLNQLTCIGLKAMVDGELCAWRAMCSNDDVGGTRQAIERCVEKLVRRFIKKPFNVAEEGVSFNENEDYLEALTFPDVELLEGKD